MFLQTSKYFLSRMGCNRRSIVIILGWCPKLMVQFEDDKSLPIKAEKSIEIE